MTFTTKSGSTYEVEGQRVRKINGYAAPDRRYEWREFTNSHVEVGRRARFYLLNSGVLRTTEVMELVA